MRVKIYLHRKSEEQAPENSIYEIRLGGLRNFPAIKNAKTISPGVFRVINEEKEVYVIVPWTHKNGMLILKIDSHLQGGHGKTCKPKTVLGSDLGVIMTDIIACDHDFCIKIHRDNETYYAGNLPSEEGKFSIISYNDLLDFVSGEIKWEDLKGESFLC